MNPTYRRLVLFLLLVPVLFALPDLSSARSCTDYTTQPQLRSTYHVDGARGIAVSDGVSYVVEATPPTYRLSAYDVSDAAAPQFLGYSAQLLGNPTAIEIAGDRAYVLETGGLRILDVLNPASPYTLAFLPLSSPPEDIAPVGDIVYLALGAAGLAIVNVSDPMHPEIVGSDNRAASRVSASPLRAVTLNGPILSAYDLADAIHPAFLGEAVLDCDVPGWDCTVFIDVGVVGTRAFAVDWKYGCVQDPDEEKVCANFSSLHAFAIDQAPSPLATLPLGVLRNWHVALSGDQVFLSGELGTQIVDVRDPSSPRILHALRKRDVWDVRACGVTGSGTQKALCRWVDQWPTPRVEILDVGNLARPHGVDAPFRESQFFRESMRDACVAGDRLYVLRDTITNPNEYWFTMCQEIRIFDLSDRDARELEPWTYCWTGFGGDWADVAQDIESVAGALYIKDWTPGSEGKLYRSNIQADGVPSDPVVLPLSRDVCDTEPAGSNLLVAMGSKGLVSLDPNSGDQVVGSLADIDVRLLDVDGALAATIGRDGWENMVFRLFDVSDPSAPMALGEIHWSCGVNGGCADDHWIAIEGETAAIGNTEGLVRIIDVSDPMQPLVVYDMQLPSSYSSKIQRGDLSGSMLYVPLGREGLGVVDARDPAHPVFVGAAATDEVLSVHAYADRIVVCDTGGTRPALFPPDCRGVLKSAVIPEAARTGVGVASTTSPRALFVAPTPFDRTTTISFELLRDSEVMLEVFDVQGRKVSRLLSGLRSAGRWDEIWDGRTSAGRQAPAGVYFLRLETDEGIQTRKVVRQH